MSRYICQLRSRVNNDGYFENLQCAKSKQSHYIMSLYVLISSKIDLIAKLGQVNIDSLGTKCIILRDYKLLIMIDRHLFELLKFTTTLVIIYVYLQRGPN